MNTYQSEEMALFKKFGRDDISSSSQVKASVARGIRGEGQIEAALVARGIEDTSRGLLQINAPQIAGIRSES